MAQELGIKPVCEDPYIQVSFMFLYIWSRVLLPCVGILIMALSWERLADTLKSNLLKLSAYWEFCFIMV